VGALLVGLAVGFESPFRHAPAGADAERLQEFGTAGQDRVHVARAFPQPLGRVPRRQEPLAASWPTARRHWFPPVLPVGRCTPLGCRSKPRRPSAGTSHTHLLLRPGVPFAQWETCKGHTLVCEQDRTLVLILLPLRGAVKRGEGCGFLSSEPSCVILDCTIKPRRFREPEAVTKAVGPPWQRYFSTRPARCQIGAGRSVCANRHALLSLKGGDLQKSTSSPP